jgi:diguanylate cyclase (GGDEF)-like protein
VSGGERRTREERATLGRRFDERVWALTALIVSSGLALFLIPDRPGTDAPRWSSVSGWVAMMALIALSEAFVIHIHLGRSAHTISLTDGVVLLSLLHVGHHATVAAVVVGGSLTLRVLRRQPLIKVAFNASTFVLCTQLAALVLRTANVTAIDSLRSIIVGFLACLVFAVTGSMLVLCVVRASGGEVAAKETLPSLGVSAAASLGTAAVGMATAALASSTPIAAPLMAVPFFTAYLSNVVYQRERQRKGEMEFLHRSAEALHQAEASERTLTALITSAQRDLHFAHVEVVLRINGTVRHAQSPEASDPSAGLGRLDDVAMPATGTADVRNTSTIGDDPLSRALLDRGLRSGLVVPIHVPDVVEGILLIGSAVEDVDAFDSRDLPLAFAMAAQIGSLVESERQSASIQELRALERRLVHELQHDSLTGLLNRSAFTRAARQVLEATGSSGGRWAVAIIDLDDFKNVNDSFGHGAGDALLVTIGRRLAGSLGPSEHAARLSGDEFAVLFDPDAKEDSVHQRGRVLLDVIRVPMILESGAELHPRATVGIGVAAANDDLASLLERADQAMYRAKARGKNAVEVIDPARVGPSGRFADVTHQLGQHVPLEQFEMAFQPVIDVVTGQTVSIEGFVRWNHPEHGSLGPDDFLLGLGDASAAEIDEFVLRSAADAIDASSAFPQVSVAINLGVTQISRASFAEILREHATSADVSRLVFEIPVRALRRSGGAVLQRLETLRSLGVGIALDDLDVSDIPFGLLSELRPSIVKLARSSVAVLSSPATAPVIQALVVLSELNDFALVAKGLETLDQCRAAEALGCSWLQGHALREPTTLSSLLDSLKTSGPTIQPGNRAMARRVPRQPAEAWSPRPTVGKEARQRSS